MIVFRSTGHRVASICVCATKREKWKKSVPIEKSSPRVPPGCPKEPIAPYIHRSPAREVRWSVFQDARSSPDDEWGLRSKVVSFFSPCSGVVFGKRVHHCAFFCRKTVIIRKIHYLAKGAICMHSVQHPLRRLLQAVSGHRVCKCVIWGLKKGPWRRVTNRDD